MEVCKVYLFMILGCLVSHLLAKPVSLNELIAAESRLEKNQEIITTQRTRTTRKPLKAKPKTVSLNDIIAEEAKRREEGTTQRSKLLKGLGKSLLLDDFNTAESRRQPRNGNKSDESVGAPRRKLLPGLKKSLLDNFVAAESRIEQKGGLATLRRKLFPETSKRFSLNKLLKLKPRKSKKLLPEIIPRKKKVSPLKYKKSLQIKSPLKSKRLEFSQKPRYKRRNQSLNKEDENEKLSRKYIPLLRSLSELLDNIDVDFTSQSSETRSARGFKNKHTRDRHDEDDPKTCTCNKSRRENSESAEETTVVTTTTKPVSTKTSIRYIDSPAEVPSTTPFIPTVSDVSDFRPNTNLPILPTRDTASTGRNDLRLSERSDATLHTSTERNLPRYNRIGKHISTNREDGSSATDYEENTDSDPRYDASNNGVGGRLLLGNRNDSRRPVYRGDTEEIDEDIEKQTPNRHVRGNIHKPKGQIDDEVGGDETKGRTTLPQFIPGFRGLVSESETRYSAESVQSKEVHEERVVGDAEDFASNQRIFDGDRASTSEVQEVGSADKTVVSIKDLANISRALNSKHKPPFVTIIDGYSVARDKNGSNKLAEQSIRFHS